MHRQNSGLLVNPEGLRNLQCSTHHRRSSIPPGMRRNNALRSLRGLRASSGYDSEQVKRAAHATAATVEHMRVDHRGRHTLVAQKLLDGADVVSFLKEMGCK